MRYMRYMRYMKPSEVKACLLGQPLGGGVIAPCLVEALRVTPVYMHACRVCIYACLACIYACLVEALRVTRRQGDACAVRYRIHRASG